MWQVGKNLKLWAEKAIARIAMNRDNKTVS